ncbi:hypothetical protein V7128_07220 [Neobacillus vireti]|uniref:hypothetical protein n=1 Tax=Neobacillus vireti TaxID=220686 RepID=UPI002FFE0FAD
MTSKEFGHAYLKGNPDYWEDAAWAVVEAITREKGNWWVVELWNSEGEFYFYRLVNTEDKERRWLILAGERVYP